MAEASSRFTRSAAFYDLIYGWKDYAGETARLREILANEAPQAKSLLDVACGTGEHLLRFTGFERVGLDHEPPFLEIARQKVPEATFVLGDMRHFRLDRRFDVVTCLFSSIGYLLDDDSIRAALGNMAAHLHPGGVLLLEPWFEPKDWKTGNVTMRSFDGGSRQGCRITVAGLEGDVALTDFHYLLADGTEVQHLTESHRLRLLTREHLTRLLRSVGFEARREECERFRRGLYVARCRA